MASTSHQRVAVTSDQSLVAEAIGAALASRGFDPVTLQWPSPASDHGRLASPRRTSSAPESLDVALLLSDLDRPWRLQGAQLLMNQLQVAWVVLAGVPRGPVWGALLEHGARVVVPMSTNLDEVVTTLMAVADGHDTMTPDERRDLTTAWQELRANRADVATRLATMSPREEEVLRLLYAGTPVKSIACELEVSEATVRSQVKKVLRKLDVKSQLAAVAAFESIQWG